MSQAAREAGRAYVTAEAGEQAPGRGRGGSPDRLPGPVVRGRRAGWRSPATASVPAAGRAGRDHRDGPGAAAARAVVRARRHPALGAGQREPPVDGRPVPGPAVSGRAPARRATEPPRGGGSISLFILGLAVIAMLLIAGAVAVTSAHLSRMRLLDVADGAALSAANALDDSAYEPGRGGVGAAEQPVCAGASGRLPRQPSAARERQRLAARSGDRHPGRSHRRRRGRRRARAADDRPGTARPRGCR